MSRSITSETVIGPSKSSALSAVETLRRFLGAYWLRPENAMWMTLRSLALRACEFRGAVVDMGCGDGIFSFLHCGGTFDPGFDVFLATRSISHKPNADMFDHMSDDYHPEILSPPTESFDVGVDIKPTMLAKAKRLGFYNRLVEHDNNRALPFDDGSFDTVYCNTAYWVREIDSFLGELSRITRRGGSIILHVKLASMQDCTLEAFRGVLGDACLNRLARGRMECWPTVADRATWESRFVAAGLTIQEATPFVTRTHAHVWDVGLRPFAPMLVKLAGGVSSETRASVKAEWIDLCLDLLTPLCDSTVDLFEGATEPAEIQYVLAPS